jgi:hypothetical protein
MPDYDGMQWIHRITPHYTGNLFTERQVITGARLV